VPAAFRQPGIAAEITLVLSQLQPAPAVNKSFTTSIMADNTWKILLTPHETGGNYSLTAECTSGCVNTGPSNNTVSAVDLTFGDVLLCTGQSNMWLPLGNTFSRNLSRAKVQAGQYSNVRIYNAQLNFPYDIAREDIFVTGGRWSGQEVGNPTDLPRGQWRHPQALNVAAWDTVYSTCWYTAEALTDMFESSNQPAPPLGIVEMAVGGTKLSQWVERGAASVCSNATCCCQYNCQPEHCPNPYEPVHGDFANTSGDTTCVGNGQMYNALVRPMINTTIKGVLWYQGENSVGFDGGSSKDHSGYACMMATLVESWRKVWSVVSDTTDNQFPIGLVTLADATDEGRPQLMRGFRWAQTANYGTAPNPVYSYTIPLYTH
jgi:sialate O-acetylesterase